mgnify:CR=1 FL=1
MNEETILKAAAIEREARQLEENLQLIEGQIVELDTFKESIKVVIESKDKEMLSLLGKRVYMKTKIEDKEKLFIEVGAGVVVKKTPEDILKIVKEQSGRLQEAKIQILLKLEEYQGQLEEFLNTIGDR